MSATDPARLEAELVDERRREKLATLRQEGVALFPAGQPVPHTSADCLAAAEGLDAEALAVRAERYSIAGRLLAKNEMGKAGFAMLSDRAGRLQIYVKRDLVGEDSFATWKRLDLGDWVRVTGRLMRTRRGDLSLQVAELELCSKCLRSLPDKWKGLTDTEFRFRHRYVDLLMNDEVRATFRARSLVLRALRGFFDARGYLEVETPMMQVIPGGAAARPFVTHHNALDLDLFLRIAPELYLKRLVVGGFERVYELNRVFRNEGLSLRHNPEFTMLEFYEAHATYRELMGLTEDLFTGLVEQLHGGLQIPWGPHTLDFTRPWRRATMQELIAEGTGLSAEALLDPEALRAFWVATHGAGGGPLPSTMGKWWEWLFDAHVEAGLVNPTFVTRFPVEISPLSRRCDDDPRFVDRFELLIAGQELANGFSELNDPFDQAGRFRAQVALRGGGDDEAMLYDADYVEALCYGMPPTAGEGIGIDRLVMLLTNNQSIREVILFPTLRPQAAAAAEAPAGAPDEA
ncbi:MAG: lysine--tRNA ligase [Pseudomonadota bacterium]